MLGTSAFKRKQVEMVVRLDKKILPCFAGSPKVLKKPHIIQNFTIFG